MYITYVEPMHRSVDKHTYICIHDIHSFSYIDYIDINNKYYNAYVQFKTNKPIFSRVGHGSRTNKPINQYVQELQMDPEPINQ